MVLKIYRFRFAFLHRDIYKVVYTYYAKIFHQKGYELKDIKNTSVREAYRYLYRKINKKRIERQRRKEIERYMKNNRKIRNKKKSLSGWQFQP